jgi:hypothetical protein
MHVARRVWLLPLLLVIAGWSSCGSGTPPAPPPPPPPAEPTFDTDRAWGFLEAQVAFGPRAPGTTGHDQAEAYLFGELQKTARRALKQEFRTRTQFGGPYDFANLIGLYGAETGKALMLCAHWDTRPVADQDPSPANRSTPVLGANDGASGVAVLLELAQAFKQAPPSIPVIVALWDAEDSGRSAGTPPYFGFLLGSQYFVEHMPAGARPDDVVLLDMVGGDSRPNARVGTRPGGNNAFDLPIERNSLRAAPDLVDEVYSAGERLGHAAFQRRQGYDVIDDHMPFIDDGFPAIDLIEFDYPEWHTVDDTPDHCDRAALQQVGETLLEVVYSRAP